MDNAYHPVTIGGKPDSRYTVSREGHSVPYAVRQRAPRGGWMDRNGLDKAIMLRRLMLTLVKAGFMFGSSTKEHGNGNRT